MITRIKVPAKWMTDASGIYFGVADFQLGLGPCGKEVKELDITFEKGYVYIRQDCGDGETKRFYYRNDDITGRVEVTYAR